MATAAELDRCAECVRLNAWETPLTERNKAPFEIVHCNEMCEVNYCSEACMRLALEHYKKVSQQCPSCHTKTKMDTPGYCSRECPGGGCAVYAPHGYCSKECSRKWAETRYEILVPKHDGEWLDDEKIELTIAYRPFDPRWDEE